MASLIAIADPEDHRSEEHHSPVKGIFTGLIRSRGYQWDVTVHAASTQKAIDQLNDAYPLSIIDRVYPGYPQK